MQHRPAETLVMVESVEPPERIDNLAVTPRQAADIPQPTGEMVLLGREDRAPAAVQ